jgi:hypothetical protein
VKELMTFSLFAKGLSFDCYSLFYRWAFSHELDSKKAIKQLAL